MRKSLLHLFLFLSILLSTGFAITLDNDPDPKSHLLPPTNYNFPAWDPSLGVLAGKGGYTDGTFFGSGGLVVYPVGPRVFARALHINDYRLSPSIKWDKINFLGKDYYIENNYILGNDVIFHTVTNDIPYWHEIWTGPYFQNKVTCFPGTTICFTNTIDRIMTNIEFIVISYGPLGNVPCSSDLVQSWVPQAHWAYATNYIYPNSQVTINTGATIWNNFEQAWASGGFFQTEGAISGNSLQILFSDINANFPNIKPYPNFGGRTGDSGSAIFCRDTNPFGKWKLVGFINGAISCHGANDSSIIDRALGFFPEYWQITGTGSSSYILGIDNYQFYQEFKKQIMNGSKYPNSITSSPVIPSTTPPSSGNIITNPVIVTPPVVTNNTNTPVVLNALTKEQKAAIRKAGTSFYESFMTNWPTGLKKDQREKLEKVMADYSEFIISLFPSK